MPAACGASKRLVAVTVTRCRALLATVQENCKKRANVESIVIFVLSTYASLLLALLQIDTVRWCDAGGCKNTAPVPMHGNWPTISQSNGKLNASKLMVAHTWLYVSGFP
jgi:hypothetical protein